MKLFLVVSLLAVGVAQANGISFLEVVTEDWETWKVTHGKTYNSSTEEQFRLKIYMENKARIAKHNNQAQRGLHTYTLEMNHFGDLLHHEFVNTMNGFRNDLRLSRQSLLLGGATFMPPAHVTILPEEVDWRTKGAVTPVKNQGQCGSCWAFSTTGSLEGQNFRKTGKLVPLSEQNLVDCSKSYGNNGCEGGLMDNAFKYIKNNGGIDTENGYPYEGEDESCRYKKASKGATDVGFTDVTPGDENALMQAVATVGPVSIAIDASHESFQFYSKGVYLEPECNPQQLDHGVLVVGYGKDKDSGKNYWLVKNSWGESWGDAGYIKMAKDKSNMCGVASSASYPNV